MTHNQHNHSSTEQGHTTIGIIIYSVGDFIKCLCGCCVCSAVHIRGGLPDGARTTLDESIYMKYVDQIAAQAKLQNKPVKVVYLCSNTQELNIVSTEHMTKKYPRPFRYAVLPHISTGPGESELALKKVNSTYDNRGLGIEFYADIEIFVKADYFIGMRNM